MPQQDVLPMSDGQYVLSTLLLVQFVIMQCLHKEEFQKTMRGISDPGRQMAKFVKDVEIFEKGRYLNEAFQTHTNQFLKILESGQYPFNPQQIRDIRQWIKYNLTGSFVIAESDRTGSYAVGPLPCLNVFKIRGLSESVGDIYQRLIMIKQMEAMRDEQKRISRASSQLVDIPMKTRQLYDRYPIIRMTIIPYKGELIWTGVIWPSKENEIHLLKSSPRSKQDFQNLMLNNRNNNSIVKSFDTNSEPKFKNVDDQYFTTMRLDSGWICLPHIDRNFEETGGRRNICLISHTTPVNDPCFCGSNTRCGDCCGKKTTTLPIINLNPDKTTFNQVESHEIFIKISNAKAVAEILNNSSEFASLSPIKHWIYLTSKRFDSPIMIQTQDMETHEVLTHKMSCVFGDVELKDETTLYVTVMNRTRMRTLLGILDNLIGDYIVSAEHAFQGSMTMPRPQIFAAEKEPNTGFNKQPVKASEEVVKEFLTKWNFGATSSLDVNTILEEDDID